MAIIMLAIVSLLAVIGLYAIVSGYPMIEIERGWASVIAGSVLLVRWPCRRGTRPRAARARRECGARCRRATPAVAIPAARVD